MILFILASLIGCTVHSVATRKILPRKYVGETNGAVTNIDDGPVRAMRFFLNLSSLIARILVPVRKFTIFLGTMTMVLLPAALRHHLSTLPHISYLGRIKNLILNVHIDWN